MATTAKGTPYVESTDLVANYPAASLALANHIDDNTGKILQVVRATDTTVRSTTSATYVDASISVTITPQRDTSAILLLWAILTGPAQGQTLSMAITDNSDNAISGAESFGFTNNGTGGVDNSIVGIAYATPATSSAITFKGRFKSGGGTVVLRNSTNTGQLFAIEVSA